MASGARLSLNLLGVVVSEMRILPNLRGIRCLGDASIVQFARGYGFGDASVAYFARDRGLGDANIA